jgi:hypothetical protein
MSVLSRTNDSGSLNLLGLGKARCKNADCAVVGSTGGKSREHGGVDHRVVVLLRGNEEFRVYFGKGS